MVFCKNCGKTIEPGIKFCENCGTPVDDQPTPRVMPPPMNQGSPVAYPLPPRGAPVAGIANKFVGRFPLYVIIGVCGVALLVLSFIIPYKVVGSDYSSNFINLILVCFTGRFAFANVMFIGICTAVIGLVIAIIGLLLHSWKVQVLSGLIFLVTPIIVIIRVSWPILQFSWVAVAILGVILLIIGGLMMRIAASSVISS